ncbi:MAG: hypothetical protein M1457_09055 [bacterium]|nr:hypothetical protein [bacterium]
MAPGGLREGSAGARRRRAAGSERQDRRDGHGRSIDRPL